MQILAWALLGLIAGAIAKAIYPGHQGGGILATMGLGIVGAIVGGFLGGILFGVGSGLTIGGVIVSVLGAILVLFLYYALISKG